MSSVACVEGHLRLEVLLRVCGLLRVRVAAHILHIRWGRGRRRARTGPGHLDVRVTASDKHIVLRRDRGGDVAVWHVRRVRRLLRRS